MRTLEHPTQTDGTFALSLSPHEWVVMELLAERRGESVDQLIGHVLRGLTADELFATASRCE
jgi:hypothetical protein